MEAFKRSTITEVVQREGGYANDPSDRGGETKHGITVAVARDYGYRGAMRDLPLDTAIEIYDRRYWQPLRLDAIADSGRDLAIVLFDYAVHSGVSRSATDLQRTLNVLNNQGRDYQDIAEDGAIGPSTLAALAALIRRRGAEGPVVLAGVINACRIEFMQALAIRSPSQERFSWGWFTRALALLSRCKNAA